MTELSTTYPASRRSSLTLTALATVVLMIVVFGMATTTNGAQAQNKGHGIRQAVTSTMRVETPMIPRRTIFCGAGKCAALSLDSVQREIVLTLEYVLANSSSLPIVNQYSGYGIPCLNDADEDGLPDRNADGTYATVTGNGVAIFATDALFVNGSSAEASVDGNSTAPLSPSGSGSRSQVPVEATSFCPVPTITVQ